jgi:hypothetical protein
MEENTSLINSDNILELPSNIVEYLLVKQMVNPVNTENMLFVKDHFNASWFQNEQLIPLFQIARNYISKYDTFPTKELIYKVLSTEKFERNREKIKKEFECVYSLDESKYSEKFIQDTIISFTKRKSGLLCYFR